MITLNVRMKYKNSCYFQWSLVNKAVQANKNWLSFFETFYFLYLFINSGPCDAFRHQFTWRFFRLSTVNWWLQLPSLLCVVWRISTTEKERKVNAFAGVNSKCFTEDFFQRNLVSKAVRTPETDSLSSDSFKLFIFFLHQSNSDCGAFKGQ